MTATLETSEATFDPESVPPARPEPVLGLGRTVLLCALVFAPAVLAGALVWQLFGSSSAPVLVVDDAGAVSRIEPGQAQPSFTIPNATVAPDGSIIYATQRDGSDKTVVLTVDADSGETLDEIALEGERSIAVVAPHGNAVALLPRYENEDAAEEAAGLYEPTPRAVTELDILYGDDRASISFTLDGNFEPETFNRDATVLYMLEFFPAEAPDRYFVRQLDLATGKITKVYSPNVELSPEMRGKARAQVLAPDFSFMYTLYTLEPDAKPLTDPTADGNQNRWAFIHVLSLEEDWSFCIFLPVPIGTTGRVELSMTISPDGKSIYVVDRISETIAKVNTRTFAVDEVGRSDMLLRDTGPSSPNVPASAVTASGDLLTTTGQGILSFGADLDAPEKIWFANYSSVVDLQAAQDANQISVALADGRIVVYDLDREAEVAILTAPGEGAGFVGPPGHAVALSQGSIECAC